MRAVVHVQTDGCGAARVGRDICMPYLDDTAAWATGTGGTFEEREFSSFQQMMQRLRLIFERFRWAQLSCKASKCEFFATSAEYLGHVVSRAGLSMDPKKIQALAEIDTTQIDTIGKVCAPSLA